MFVFIWPRRVLFRAGDDVGAAPLSGVAVAGLLTSVAAAGGTGCCRFRARRDLAEVGPKVQLLLVPAAGVSMRRFPLFLARKEIIVGEVPGVMAVSPGCSTTAV